MLSIGHNEFIYADECISAFGLWLRAGNIEKAMEQAHKVLQTCIDEEWIKYISNPAERLFKIVSGLYLADYKAEARRFADAVNQHFESQGLVVKAPFQDEAPDATDKPKPALKSDR